MQPGTSKIEEHTVTLVTIEPVKVKQYPIPCSKQGQVNSVVKKMLKLGIIEPETSDYN